MFLFMRSRKSEFEQNFDINLLKVLLNRFQNILILTKKNAVMAQILRIKKAKGMGKHRLHNQAAALSKCCRASLTKEIQMLKSSSQALLMITVPLRMQEIDVCQISQKMNIIRDMLKRFRLNLRGKKQ